MDRNNCCVDVELGEPHLNNCYYSWAAIVAADVDWGALVNVLEDPVDLAYLAVDIFACDESEFDHSDLHGA